MTNADLISAVAIEADKLRKQGHNITEPATYHPNIVWVLVDGIVWAFRPVAPTGRTADDEQWTEEWFRAGAECSLVRCAADVADSWWISTMCRRVDAERGQLEMRKDIIMVVKQTCEHIVHGADSRLDALCDIVEEKMKEQSG